jgi:CheY-like chemotaxis protein
VNILVVQDVEETRDLLERLFTADGYLVDAVRNEHEAIRQIRRRIPGLILISLAGPHSNVIETASRIRKNTDLSDEVPIVLFCIDALPEGCEMEIEKGIYLTRPDNFNQLRKFLVSLSHRGPPLQTQF